MLRSVRLEWTPQRCSMWGRTERTDRGSLSPRSAIRAATMVDIPVRPGFFDLAAVRETVATARELNKPYAVVINAGPVKREDQEAPAVAVSRARASTPAGSARALSGPPNGA